ncbi:unnamed protein product, partial [Prorocentrum cordatum]
EEPPRAASAAAAAPTPLGFRAGPSRGWPQRPHSPRPSGRAPAGLGAGTPSSPSAAEREIAFALHQDQLLRSSLQATDREIATQTSDVSDGSEATPSSEASIPGRSAG